MNRKDYTILDSINMASGCLETNNIDLR